MGLANRLCEPGETLEQALDLAAFPQLCMRADRRSSYEQWGLEMDQALLNEARHGLGVIRSGQALAGARRFAVGAGRHGEFS